MKKTIKVLGIIALVAVIGFSMTACPDGGGGGGNAITVTSIDDLEGAIAGAKQAGTIDDPIPLKLKFDLESMKVSNSIWQKLLAALETQDKFVSLDLSGCTMTGTEFEPNATTFDGEDKIVELVLPNAATSLSGGNNVFWIKFTEMKSISGKEITDIGSIMTFQACPALESVSFPKVTSIGAQMFDNSPKLKSVNIPSVTVISGYDVFYQCPALASVTLGTIKEADWQQARFSPGMQLREAYFGTKGGRGTYTRTPPDNTWTKR